MSLAFCSFSSGSDGNCYLVKTEKAAVLIDAGISASRIINGLSRTETPKEDVKALFLTHEHHDHVTGARVLLKNLTEAKVYASLGTMEGTSRRDRNQRLSFANEISKERQIVISPDEAVNIEDITVFAFRTLHDAAEPYGYLIRSGKESIAILTDTGYVTDDMIYNIADAEVLVLEANHDTELLRNGQYPYPLKQRILSDRGHLSNSQTADALIRSFEFIKKKRVKHKNNTLLVTKS